MRPGEVCAMRGMDLDRSGEQWVYRPASHKTQMYGIDRAIPLGPQARQIIRGFLRPDPAEYLFRPEEAEAKRKQQAHERRRTPPNCGARPGDHRRRRPRRSAGERYTTNTYSGAIRYACRTAFPPPEDLRRARVPARGRKAESTRWETHAEWRGRLGDARWAALKRWEGEHHFHPHQLRHTAATKLRKQYGLEAAQVILGHRTLAVTEIYAEKNIAAARKIMENCG